MTQQDACEPDRLQHRERHVVRSMIPQLGADCPAPFQSSAFVGFLRTSNMASASQGRAGRSAKGSLLRGGYAISVSTVMEFEWDEAKHAKTMRERGVGFDDGARIFARPVLIWEDTRRDYREDRFRAIGETDGDILHVGFTWRLDAVRIISVRRASRKEAQLRLSQK